MYPVHCRHAMTTGDQTATGGSKRGEVVRRRGLMRRVPVALAAVVTLGACSSGDDLGTGAEPGVAESEPAVDSAIDMSMSGSSTDSTAELLNDQRAIAIEMYVTMVSDDLRATVESILDRAAALGGTVASTNIDYGTEERAGSAYLSLDIPPANVEILIDALEEFGSLESVSQSAEDVTDQLTDLDVRIDNAQRSVDRIVALFDEADDIADIVALESELTIRQTNLEQLLAIRQALEDRVEMSKVNISVATDPDALDEPRSGLWDAVVTGWEGFVSLAYGALLLFLVLIPLWVIAAAVLVVVLVVRRVRRRRD